MKATAPAESPCGRHQTQSATNGHRLPKNTASNVFWSLFHKEIIYSAAKKGRGFGISLSYIGPFKVIKEVSPVAYELDLPLKYGELFPVCHVGLLKAHKSDPARPLCAQQPRLVEEVERGNVWRSPRFWITVVSVAMGVREPGWNTSSYRRSIWTLLGKLPLKHGVHRALLLIIGHVRD
jgi:hypothetical protein